MKSIAKKLPVKTEKRNKGHDDQEREKAKEAAEILTKFLGHDPWKPMFLEGLADMVVHYHGGMQKLAKKTGFGRESLYRSLSDSCDPRISTVQRVLHAMGLRLAVTPLSQEESKLIRKRWKYFSAPVVEL